MVVGNYIYIKYIYIGVNGNDEKLNPLGTIAIFQIAPLGFL